MKNNQPLAGQKILSILTVNGVRIHLEDGSWGLVELHQIHQILLLCVKAQYPRIE